MAALITSTQLKQHVETGLEGDAIDRVINGMDAEIIDRLGALATETEVLTGGDKFLHLTRQATAVSNFPVERVLGTNTTLAANDYSLLSDGFRVERLTDGDNGFNRWQGIITISYLPIDETAKRVLALIDLCRIELRLMGVKKSTVGPCTTESLNAEAEKNKIFQRLNTSNRRLLT